MWAAALGYAQRSQNPATSARKSPDMDKVFELLAALTRLQALGTSDVPALLAALRGAAGKLDEVFALTLDETTNQEAMAQVLVQAVAGLFLIARGVGADLNGGTFADAVETLITPKAPDQPQSPVEFTEAEIARAEAKVARLKADAGKP